jgi:hypothetical protein
MKVIITVSLGPKWEKEHNHDPMNKKTGFCPLDIKMNTGQSRFCTDITGRHHSIEVEVESMAEIKSFYRGLKVTRVEPV